MALVCLIRVLRTKIYYVRPNILMRMSVLNTPRRIFSGVVCVFRCIVDNKKDFTFQCLPCRRDVDDAGWWLGKRWRHVDSSLLTKRTTIYIISAAIKVGDNLLVGGRGRTDMTLNWREKIKFLTFLLWTLGPIYDCSFCITGDEDTTTGQCPLSEYTGRWCASGS